MKTQESALERALDDKLVIARKSNLKRLDAIEHRLEFVEVYEEVEYVNDAKACDANSSWNSLEGMSKPVVWIVSSCTTEEDYSIFNEMEVENIRGIIVMGSNPEPVMNCFKERVALVGQVNTMLEAVSHATLVAEQGDIVLYSPGCNDFDAYAHYKEQGQAFRKAVREMRL